MKSPGPSLRGRVCMVTGSNSGIGKATALGLARKGATVVMVCREAMRGLVAQTEIKAESGNERVDLLLADLSAQTAIRQLAKAFVGKYDRLHVLVNNAGVFLPERSETEDGLEATFAVNYLAPFLLTNLLLGTLRASAPTRIVNVAGATHRKGVIDFDDLQCEEGYDGFRANNQSKLALVLFTYELARRLQGTGVTANCLHPGAVRTNIQRRLPRRTRLLATLFGIFFRSPTKGSETPVYLASSPEVEGITGKYFVRRKAVESSPESYDESVAKRLWQVSEELTELEPWM